MGLLTAHGGPGVKLLAMFTRALENDWIQTVVSLLRKNDEGSFREDIISATILAQPACARTFVEYLLEHHTIEMKQHILFGVLNAVFKLDEAQIDYQDELHGVVSVVLEKTVTYFPHIGILNATEKGRLNNLLASYLSHGFDGGLRRKFLVSRVLESLSCLESHDVLFSRIGDSTDDRISTTLLREMIYKMFSSMPVSKTCEFIANTFESEMRSSTVTA